MKLKLLCSIICGIFMGFSSLLYAQATEIAPEERDLSSNGASVTDVYFRHIDNQAWIDTEHNKTVKSPIERVRVLSPYDEKVAIVGKFNFVPLDHLLKPGDFVRVPLPSHVTLITRNYEIKDSNDNVIGHIVADNTKNYITFVFNRKIEYRTNVEGNFSIGAVLNAPVGDTPVTLDKGLLQEYSYLNDPKTTIYRGGNSVTITNVYQPSNVKEKEDPCQYFWQLRGKGTSIDEHLTWTMYFNMNKYYLSATVYNNDITNKDYSTKKVIFKLFGNQTSKEYKDRQSFLPFIRDSFEFYEANVADGSIIGDKLKLFTDATEFANYTGTEQAGLITFNKSDYEVTIELKHGVGTKAYKVVYKTDNPADATYVGCDSKVNVDGQDINRKSEGCEDNGNSFFDVIPTSLPLGVEANTDWANRLFLTKYKREEEKGAILPVKDVSFTLNKFVAGSDTEIDTAFPTITLTTDAKGKAKSMKLSAGKYILKETILPKGGGYMPYVEKFEVIENNEEPILKTIINAKKRINFKGTNFRKYFPNLPAGSQYPEVSLNVKVTYAKDKNNNNITNPTVINIPVTIPAGTLGEGKNYVPFEPLKNIIEYDEYGNELEDIDQLIFEITEPKPPVGYAPEYNYGNNSMWIANYKEEVNTIQIYKYLDGNSSEAGEGAKFTIEKLDASGAVDTSFTKVTLTTGANGFAISETLTAGDYLLKEIRPANQIYTKSKPNPNPDPKATPEVEYKYEIEGGVYEISDKYRKGVKVTIVDGKTNLIKVNNESVLSYGVWTRKGKKMWKGAKSVAIKPEVRLRVKLTYKPNKNDADGNPYPESVRILKPIIAAGTPTTDKDGNEEVEFEYRIPNIDFYGNNYTSPPDVAIEEENIPGYKSEVDDSTYKIDKIIKVINTLAPPVVRVNPNLRMRISEDH